MKKLILVAGCFSFMIAATAQKSAIRSAKNYLSDKEYDKAKKSIEDAVNDPSTKDDAGAWHIRGVVYLAIQQQPQNEAKEIYPEAGKSFKKAISLDPSYEKEDLSNKLFAVAIYNFNDGLKAFDKADKASYEKAYNYFNEVVAIHDLENGKRFAGRKQFDTIAHQSALYKGYSAYYSDRFDDALPVLISAKTDPIIRNENVYLLLSDIYEGKNDEANLLATIDEGRKAYPENKALVIRELNYYIKSNKTEVLVKKLEDAIAADPSNVDLLFSLGTAYDGMANPKDKTGKETAKPQNYAEMFGKAETAYMNALKINAEKPEVNFNLGALYFNRAVLINVQMNEITGTSASEMKKYDDLKAQREDWFNKALPYLEKTYTLLDPQAATIGGEDKKTYQSSLIALKEIYAKQNKLDKSAAMKKKLEDSMK